LDLGAGDLGERPQGGGTAGGRGDQAEDQGLRLLEAVRVEAPVYHPGPPVEEIAPIAASPAPVPPAPVFLDLPLLQSEDVAHAPYLAVAATPWPGEVAVYASGTDADYGLNTLVELGARVGITRSDLPRAMPGRLDRGPALRVEMLDGGLSSVPEADLLNGANAMAIGDGSSGNWEIFQYRQADLVGSDLYDLSERLRGQLGTDALIPDLWPAGSLVVVLDAALVQIDLASNARGLSRHYRIGPAEHPYTDASFVHRQEAFSGNGLRPYAPVHLRGRVASNGDHHLSWVRRSRIDGNLWTLPEIPLGESSEAYLLRIHQGGLSREMTVTSPAWTYGVAQRAADGVTGAYQLEVAQISDRYGPGLFGKVTIHG
jgi:hypothetical protein